VGAVDLPTPAVVGAPLWQPPLPEASEHDLVMVPAIPVMMPLAPRLDAIAGALVVRDTSLVVRDCRRADLPEVERVERNLEQQQLRFGAEALIPIRLGDPGAGHGRTIDPVEIVEPGCADRRPISEADRENHIAVVPDRVEVLFLTDHRDRPANIQVPPNVRIVDRLLKEREVSFFVRRTQVHPLTADERRLVLGCHDDDLLCCADRDQLLGQDLQLLPSEVSEKTPGNVLPGRLLLTMWLRYSTRVRTSGPDQTAFSPRATIRSDLWHMRNVIVGPSYQNSRKSQSR